MVLYIPHLTGFIAPQKSHSEWLEFHNSNGKENKKQEYSNIYMKILDLFKELKKPHNRLSIMHGFDCDTHIRLSRGMYINYFRMRKDWLNATVDIKIVKKYRNNLAYDKYSNKNITTYYKDFSVCFLSLKKRTFDNGDIECMRWATQAKRYTIFKIHPQIAKANPKRIKKFIQICKNLGYLSEYTVLLYDNCNVSDLINKSNFVYGSESSVIIQALIAGKPCFLTSETPFLDIIPTYYKIPDDYVPIKIHEDTVNKFITWYYYAVCIDINKENWQHLIKKRYDMYQDNMTDHEVLTWENACKNGLQ